MNLTEPIADVHARAAQRAFAVVVYHPDSKRFEHREVPHLYLGRAFRADAIALPSCSGWRVVDAFPVRSEVA